MFDIIITPSSVSILKCRSNHFERNDGTFCIFTAPLSTGIEIAVMKLQMTKMLVHLSVDYRT